MKRIQIIYHSPCFDGTASAWCFHHFLESRNDIHLIYSPYNYTDTPLSSLNNIDELYIVDFSFDINVILDLCKKVKRKVFLLDHHQTAIDKLSILQKNCPFTLHLELDISRAGCQITWDYLSKKYNGEILKRPWFLDYIADRDLWTWKLPYSKEINKVLHFDKWISSFDKLDVLKSNRQLYFNEFRTKGKTYLDIENKLLAKIAWQSKIGVLHNKKMYIVNTTIFISEIGNYMLEHDKQGIDTVLIWRYNIEHKRFDCSVRTKETQNAIDICKSFGGGGHPRAAGFSTTDNLLSLIHF